MLISPKTYIICHIALRNLFPNGRIESRKISPHPKKDGLDRREINLFGGESPYIRRLKGDTQNYPTKLVISYSYPQSRRKTKHPVPTVKYLEKSQSRHFQIIPPNLLKDEFYNVFIVK